jgi:hypothetical protein
MLWIAAAVMLVAGITALLVVMLTKRSAHVDQLGAVSEQWIAQHRVDLP